jgi:hypothetical protein
MRGKVFYLYCTVLDCAMAYSYVGGNRQTDLPGFPREGARLIGGGRFFQGCGSSGALQENAQRTLQRGRWRVIAASAFLEILL